MKVVLSSLVLACCFISCGKDSLPPPAAAPDKKEVTTESITVGDYNDQVWKSSELTTAGVDVIIASYRSYSTPAIQTTPIKMLTFKYGLRGYADGSVRLSEYQENVATYPFPYGSDYFWKAYKVVDFGGITYYAFKNIKYQKWLSRNAATGEPILVDSEFMRAQFDLSDGVSPRRVDYVMFSFRVGFTGYDIRSFDAPFMEEGASIEAKTPNGSSENQRWILYGPPRY